MGSEFPFETKNLSFSYDGETNAVNRAELHIRSGKITAVLGANGCGKSTLFSLLCRLMKPTEGEILLNGTPVRQISRREYARQVAIVHQYNTAAEDITVKKLVSLGRTPYHGICSAQLNAEDLRQISRAMEITDVADFADRPVLSLSGGQRQRVWLAMALAQNTRVLLLDEITTYLDIHYQLELMKLIRTLNVSLGITVLMVLHDLNQAIRYSDYCILMKDGAVLAQGSMRHTITADAVYEAFVVTTKIETLNGEMLCVFE